MSTRVTPMRLKYQTIIFIQYNRKVFTHDIQSILRIRCEENLMLCMQRQYLFILQTTLRQ